jgi:hypothetical protein
LPFFWVLLPEGALRTITTAPALFGPGDEDKGDFVLEYPAPPIVAVPPKPCGPPLRCPPRN